MPDLERICLSYLTALQDLRLGNPTAERRYDWALLELLDQMVRTTHGGEMTEWLIAHGQMPMLKTPRGIFDRAKASARRLLGVDNPIKTGESHRWMYDAYSLGRLFKQAGFINVRRTSHLDSYVANWPKYALDNNPDGSAYKPESLHMEGVKPQAASGG